jgi:hypothetical protein
MSTSATGRVLNELGKSIAGLTLVVRDESALFPSDLANAPAAVDRSYTVPIPIDRMTDVFGTRQLGVYVRAGVHKDLSSRDKVSARRVLYSSTYPDSAGDILPIPDITLRQIDVKGWPVSLPGTANKLAARNGNAPRPLPDDKVAWQHIADSIPGAQQSVSVMQLDLELPHNYPAGKW